jgi:hypothetical protein
VRNKELNLYKTWKDIRKTGDEEGKGHPHPLRCMGKSAEAIDSKGVMSTPLWLKSAELYEKKKVR